MTAPVILIILSLASAIGGQFTASAVFFCTLVIIFERRGILRGGK